MQINERCERVHLINLIEEEDLCNLCQYCKFLDKLQNSLNENLFFTVNAHVKLWDVRFKDNKLEVIRVL